MPKTRTVTIRGPYKGRKKELPPSRCTWEAAELPPGLSAIETLKWKLAPHEPKTGCVVCGHAAYVLESVWLKREIAEQLIAEYEAALLQPGG